MMYLLVSIGILVLMVFVFLLVTAQKLSKGNLPPSPPTLPILGNLHQLIRLKVPPHVTFTRLAKTYGPVFTIWFGNKPAVIINNFKIAKYVLFSRQCHGRPQRDAGRIISKNFKGVIVADAGCPLQHRRAVFKRILDKNEENLQNLLMQESSRLIQIITDKLGKSDDSIFDISEEITTISYNVVMKMVFSTEVSNNSTLLCKLQQLMKWLMEGLTITNICEGFPFLRKLPIGRVFFLDLYQKEMFAFISKQYDEHLENYQEHYPKDLTDFFINEQRNQPSSTNEATMLTRDNIEVILSDIFVTSLDTITSTLKLIILYLSYYKEHAKKCRSEINQMMTSTTEADKEENQTSSNFKVLNFLQAFVSETLRHTTVAPLGVPHKTVSDMNVQGHTIPSGTTVFVNIDCIHHDESSHKNAELFNPERFLDDDGKYKHIDGFLPFSIGRRQCLGKSYAMKTIMYFTVQLLKNFDFTLPNNKKLPTKFSYDTTVKVESLLMHWGKNYRDCHEHVGHEQTEVSNNANISIKNQINISTELIMTSKDMPFNVL